MTCKHERTSKSLNERIDTLLVPFAQNPSLSLTHGV